jgi:hypothetical protein
MSTSCNGRAAVPAVNRAMPVLVLLGLVLLGVGATLPASAHHSFALFDHQNRVTVTGTVVKFEWTNPHVFIQLAVADGTQSTRYTVECASPNVLTRVGWKFNDVKQGDKVTLLINPLRNGQPGGMLEKATLADGRELSDGNPPAGVFPRS